MINNYQIGSIIKRFRELHGYSIDELAKLLCFTSRYIYDIELGNKGMTLDTLEKICGILNISANYLLSEKNETCFGERLYILSLTENVPNDRLSHLVKVLEKAILLSK